MKFGSQSAIYHYAEKYHIETKTLYNIASIISKNSVVKLIRLIPIIFSTYRHRRFQDVFVVINLNHQIPNWVRNRENRIMKGRGLPHRHCKWLKKN